MVLNSTAENARHAREVLMNRRGLCFLVSFLLVVCSGLALSEGQAGTRDVPWSVGDILGDTVSHKHVSVAADGFWGMIFIVYYDAENGDLRWVRSVDSGGNCGPGNAWKCEALATAGDVGKYNSIAIRNNPGGVYFIIPYYDATNERLMYLSGSVQNGVLSHTTYVLDSGIVGYDDRTGMYTAVEYDGNADPWIAYQNETYGAAFGTHQLVARWVGDGSGNCGAGAVVGDWDCRDILNSGFAQSFGSTGMTVDDLGRPVVAFYDDQADYPILAVFVGSGGSCVASASWRCYSVPPRAGQSETGRYVDPFVADGGMTLFYQNLSTGMLEKATYVHPTSGNCGWSSGTMSYQWQCDSIDYMDGTLADRSLSVAADSHDYPIVAYQFGDEPGPPLLRIARPVASPEVDSPGNCGVANSWHCQTLDGGPNQTVAKSLSLVVDYRGAGYLAYHEFDEYDYEHNLKFATMPGPAIFANGFESGNTSAWSVTFP